MAIKFLFENNFVSSERTKEIINPYTNKPVGDVFIASGEHFEKSSDYLNDVFKKYSAAPTYIKSELLFRISKAIADSKENLAQLITMETGKPIKFSRIEIERAVLTFRLGAEECSKIPGEVLPLDLLKGSENKIGIVRRFPLGLILGITPWNFPVNLVAHKVSPALASSNVIIIKPSSNSLMCGIELGKIIFEVCKEIGLDYCPINVLTLTGSEMDKHINDDRVKLISFTGSPDIGWKLKKQTNRQKVSLELGGNAGVIADEGTDISKAVSKIITGGFAATGQSCISVQRIYAHKNIYNEFKKCLIEEVKKIKFGDPFNEDTISGPMITEEEAIRAEEWVNEAKQNGASILTGGKRSGAVLEPTVIENADNSLKVKCNEVFAPIVTLDVFEYFQKAIDEINNSRYGLQAGVFTNNLEHVLYAYNNIHTGGVVINDASAYRMDSMPYGGVKESGNTREGVAYAIKEMSEEKILII